jgi:hypothetical protein
MGTFAETAIVVYRLSITEKQLPFSVSVCSKKTEVYRLRFLLAAKKRKLPFSVEFRKNGVMNMAKWKHG